MIELNAGNVLLKPSQRRQLMSWLRRAVKLGERLGNFRLTLSMNRTGRAFEVRADVKDSIGNSNFRTRRNDWGDAIRELIRQIVAYVHTQWVLRAAA
jgi:hypothetical protein